MRSRPSQASDVRPTPAASDEGGRTAFWTSDGLMFHLPRSEADARDDADRRAQWDGAIAWCTERFGPAAPPHRHPQDAFTWGSFGFYPRDPYGNDNPTLLSGIYFGNPSAAGAFRFAMGIADSSAREAAIREFGEGTDTLCIENGDGVPTPHLLKAVLVHAMEGNLTAGWIRRKGEHRVVDGIGTIRVGDWQVSVVMDSGRLDHVHAAVSPEGREARHDVVGTALGLMDPRDRDAFAAWLGRVGPWR